MVLYAGGLTEIRGIYELIEAVGILKGKVELLLFGDWDDLNYESQCKNSVGWKYVHFKGFKPLEEVYSYMKISNIGAAMLYPVLNHQTSYLIKTFEYMACGLPMIISNFPAWKNFFRNYALFANPKSPSEISEKIEMLVDNKELSGQFREKGLKAIEEKYSWEKEQENLFKLYSEIVDY